MARGTVHALAPLLVTTALLLSGCLGLGGEAPLAAQAPLRDEDRPLKEFDVFGSFGFMEPLPGQRVSALVFQVGEDDPGSVPAKEIRVTQGDRVRVRLHTDAFAHTLHWHGLSVPWAMDGVPYMTQGLEATSTYTYEFNADETGTYWYHCHVDAPTHIDFGMFGAFIVEPRDKAQDPPFDREATVILHEVDRRGFLNNPLVNGAVFGDPARSPAENPTPASPVDLPTWGHRNARDAADLALLTAGGATGQYGTSAGPRDYYPQASLQYHPYYDTFMINGKSFPETEPLLTRTGETLRIRIINAGQLLHTMHLHGHHFLVTHKDGYNLPAPYHADSIVVGPGERYDVYVKANNPGIWDFHDHGGSWELGAYAANDHAFPGGMNTMVVYEDFEYAQLPQPEPGERRTSGDYMVWAASFKGPAPSHAHARAASTGPLGAVDAAAASPGAHRGHAPAHPAGPDAVTGAPPVR